MTRPKKQVKAEELGLRLGRRIAEIRKKRSMTQAMLAETVGVDSETISRFERGTALPSLVRLFEIAQALDAGVGDLLVEASVLAHDTALSFVGVFDGMAPADQKLLRQIAELMRNRRVEKK